MKRFLFVFIACICTFLGMSQDPMVNPTINTLVDPSDPRVNSMSDDVMLAEPGTYPIITFEQDTISLGTVKKGESINARFNFVNTGQIPLDIEIVTSCKCTSLSWPQSPVEPNGIGSIFVTFDSTDYEGDVLKVVDIIANTNPIVVEAFFKVNVTTED